MHYAMNSTAFVNKVDTEGTADSLASIQSNSVLRSEENSRSEPLFRTVLLQRFHYSNTYVKDI